MASKREKKHYREFVLTGENRDGGISHVRIKARSSLEAGSEGLRLSQLITVYRITDSAERSQVSK